MTFDIDYPTGEQPVPSVLPELPTFITLQDGRQYNIEGDVWVLPRGVGIKPLVRFDWTLLINIIVTGTSLPVMSERAVTLVKRYVLERLNAACRDSIKPTSARGYLRALLAFARHLSAHPAWMPTDRSFDWSDMSADMFDGWLTLEYQKRRKGDYAGLVRRFYVWGADPDTGYPDFSADLASELCGIRLKGNAEGELVESRDAKRGPFTHQELELMFSACEMGAGNDQDRAIVWTFLETGIRPVQLFKLTNQDLKVGASGGEDNCNGVDGALTEISYGLRGT